MGCDLAGMDNPFGDFGRELAMDDIAAETLKQNILYHALFVSAFFLTCLVWVVVHFKSPLAGMILSFLTIVIGLSATELSVRVRSKVPLVVLFDLIFAYFQWKGPWFCPAGEEKAFHQTWQRRGLLITVFLAANILWTGLKRDSGRDQIHILMLLLVVLLAVHSGWYLSKATWYNYVVWMMIVKRSCFSQIHSQESVVLQVRVWKTVSGANVLRKQTTNADNADDALGLLEDSRLLLKPVLTMPVTGEGSPLTRGAGVFVLFTPTTSAWWLLYIFWNIIWVATCHSDSLTGVLHDSAAFTFGVAGAVYINTRSADRRQPSALVNWSLVGFWFV